MLDTDPTSKQAYQDSRSRLPTIEIENFGPIASGKIELKPLTILIGSNNSGKSYAALLIYSIMNSESKTAQEIVGEIIENIEIEIWSKNPHRSTSTITSFDKQFNINTYKNFEKELRRNFSSQLSELVQFKQTTCSLKISSARLQSKITISDNTMQTPTNDNSILHLKVDKPDQNNRNLVSIKNDTVVIRNNAITSSRMSNIIGRIYKHYYRNLSPVHYLPASRYGVLQSHKILASQIVKHAPYVGLEDLHIPQMPGAVADFLGNLLDMPIVEGSCSNIAKQLEQNMLHGTIYRQDKKFPTEISYRYNDQLVPLHRVSSMVSEIAPLILYLRHWIGPKSLLIIEEPESHLHPSNQIYLAKCIVDLIRRGVYVLITTHSPYLVEQIGNYLQASGISDRNRLNIQDDKNRYIKLEEIAAYLFDAEHEITKIKKIHMSIDNGIEQNQFVDAFESISKHSRLIEKYYENS